MRCTRVPSSMQPASASHPQQGCAGTDPLPRQHLEPHSCLQHAQAAGSTPRRAPWLSSLSPASFPPALRPASCCSACPSPSSSSVRSPASSLFSKSSQQCIGDRTQACRGRGGGGRERGFSCDGAKQAEGAPASPGHPHHSGHSCSRLAQQALEDTELLGSFPGWASPACFGEAGSCLVGMYPGRAAWYLPGPG